MHSSACNRPHRSLLSCVLLLSCHLLGPLDLPFPFLLHLSLFLNSSFTSRRLLRWLWTSAWLLSWTSLLSNIGQVD